MFGGRNYTSHNLKTYEFNKDLSKRSKDDDSIFQNSIPHLAHQIQEKYRIKQYILMNLQSTMLIQISQ